MGLPCGGTSRTWAICWPRYCALHGILFLDELTKFKRHALEVLRQPAASAPGLGAVSGFPLDTWPALECRHTITQAHLWTVRWDSCPRASRPLAQVCRRTHPCTARAARLPLVREQPLHLVWQPPEGPLPPMWGGHAPPS